MKHPIVFQDIDDTSAEALIVEWVVSVGGPFRREKLSLRST